MNLPNKKIYALDDYYFPITEKEKQLVNIEYKITDKKDYKNGENVGCAIIKLGNKIIHKEKLYINVTEKTKEQKTNFLNKLWQKIFD